MNKLHSLAVLAGAALAAATLSAQNAPSIAFPAPSPAATVTQRVGVTDIEVNYSRPSMRGRQIFGGLVPFGEVWRTGANTATKITFSTAVKFGGADVPAGSYALYSIPTPDQWTVILSKVTGEWGAYQYDPKNDLVRVTVKPETYPRRIETFTIGLANLDKEADATLYLLWDNVLVPVKIETDLVSVLQPQIEAVMASDSPKKPYFPAAMFYYENNLDLKKAADWMSAAIAANPNAYYMIYRKGLILAKAGDKAGAIEAANQSLAMAQKDSSPAGEEYARLNRALIATLQ
ncbi:MAG TPA: DUF2911 domain-containing protein [Opitutus sp.]|nr:DUF2911 domain-containing protein [Opitutus sp.]